MKVTTIAAVMITFVVKVVIVVDVDVVLCSFSTVFVNWRRRRTFLLLFSTDLPSSHFLSCYIVVLLLLLLCLPNVMAVLVEILLLLCFDP